MLKELFLVFALGHLVLGGPHHWKVVFERNADGVESSSIDLDSSEEIENAIEDLEKTSNEYQESEDWKAFVKFQTDYGKLYDTADDQMDRFKIFQKNLRLIEKLNADEDDFATYGINQFSDLTEEELLNGVNGLNRSADFDNFWDSSTENFNYVPHDIPLEDLIERGVGKDFAFDWRKQNKVSQVKNQGACGSCWSFSCNGMLESQLAIKHNRHELLSEQDLLDCIGSCQGYWPINALKQAQARGGVDKQSDYPYTGHKSTCRFQKNKVGVTIKSVTSLKRVSEDKLKEHVEKFGPISVCMNFHYLHTYKGGISNLKGCQPQSNHAVLLVGFGVEKGINFWILKNSWGTHWGENGFFRIYRGSNMCGITEDPVMAEIN